MANPEEIVEYILNLISKKNSYMTGETITVAGGEWRKSMDIKSIILTI